MNFKRVLLTLQLLFIFCSGTAISQTKIPSKKAILDCAAHATKLMRQENYEQSLIESRQLLKQAIASKDDYLIALCYNLIAANFDGIAEFEKAFFYYQKGLVYANKTTNEDLKNRIYNNLGNIYCFDKKEYEKGIQCYKKSLDFSKKIGDYPQVLLTNLNITWAYFDIGEFKKGYPYLQFINKNQYKYGDQSVSVAIHMLNGMYYNFANIPSKATYHFEKAIEIGTKENEITDLSFSHQEYSRFLLKQGKYKKAYENLARYNVLNNEINSEDKLKKTNMEGINLEIDEYKREIDNVEVKYKTKEQALIDKQKKNKQISIIIISLLLVCLILLYFFFQNMRLKQKNKMKDVQRKIQENMINASISGQELERKKIANFLHDNISALLSSAGMHLSVLSSKSSVGIEEINKTKCILNEAHDKVRDLSHQLLPSLLARFGLYYALKDLCEKNSNSNISFNYQSTVCIKTRYSEEFELKMYFMITELLNNIIKHSDAKNAELNMVELDDFLLIKISDDGKGFDRKDYKSIEGFGLSQIKVRLNNMNGKIKINSQIDSGTIIHIKAPLPSNKS
jgi:signal transduction histidine kinase